MLGSMGKNKEQGAGPEQKQDAGDKWQHILHSGSAEILSFSAISPEPGP